MPLTIFRDGIAGRDLGIIGECQYALADDGQVYRRRADEAGSYGGWRWECSSYHPALIVSDPMMAKIAAALLKLRP